MLFSSPTFLFIFLPLVLFLFFLVGKRAQILFLILASIIFYFWGQTDFVLIILILIYLNYSLGKRIQRFKTDNRLLAKKVLIFSIILNLGFLIYYKYRFFLLSNLILVNKYIPTPQIITDFLSNPSPFLPLAISFFIFHAISYQIDIYQKKSIAEKDIKKLALYFLMFPHLLAGPILRYHQIKDQLEKRIILKEDFIKAINRFIIGLGKKVLIADRLAATANEIFAIPAQRLDISTAWLGIICFTLQIYFDFSAYSDMAIGLAKMFGFNFPENFNYPYISSSIREFWRRWHITLSNWFRDYLYIPLGGSRRNSMRVYLNLMIVFLLCGLWHGTRWNFVIWGGIHGLFLILERVKNGSLINFLPKPLKHLYVLSVVITSWVFFRTESIDEAITYLKTLSGFGENVIKYRPINYFISNDLIITLLVAVILSFPVYAYVNNLLHDLTKRLLKYNYALIPIIQTTKIVYFMILLFLSFLMMAIQTYRPFVYFKF